MHAAEATGLGRPQLQFDAAHDLRGDDARRGHAVNALPQRAKATVNCRIIPGEDGDTTKRCADQGDRRCQGGR
jgi:acetylornithine deacetylase/succinyl-diaminopimelate desuccinylase-like protein